MKGNVKNRHAKAGNGYDPRRNQECLAKAVSQKTGVSWDDCMFWVDPVPVSQKKKLMFFEHKSCCHFLLSVYSRNNFKSSILPPGLDKQQETRL